MEGPARRPGPDQPMKQITVPFTPEQVDLLNQFQVGVSIGALGHPFTCVNRSEGISYSHGRRDECIATHGTEGGDLGLLVATTDGWVCPSCGHTQNWAYEFMAQSPSSEAAACLSPGLVAAGMASPQALLARTQKALVDYAEWCMYRRRSLFQTPDQIDQSNRICKASQVMVASLRKHEAALLDLIPAPAGANP